MSKRSEEYQGWANRETWAVNLRLTNDQGLYSQVNDLSGEHRDIYAFSDAIKLLVEDLTEGNSEGIIRDLLGCALNRVEWDEIAKAWRS